MTTRLFTIGRIVRDGSLAPVVGRAITASLIIPGGTAAVDLESDSIVPDSLTTTTGTNGAYSFSLAFPGDLSPAGCLWVINEGGGVVIVQPASWVYASSVDPWTWYLAGQGATGTIAMSLTLKKGDVTAVTPRAIHVSPQQNTIAPDSSELSVSASVDASVDGTGRAIIYLWPTLSLTPNTYYTCRIDGETTKLSFSVPDHPTGYVGVYDGATTYHVHDGAAYQNIYTPGLVAPDVLSYSGAYYVAILDGSGHLPTNTTYFAPWIAEPITWHLTPFGTVQGIPAPGSAVADATTGSTGVVELRTAASGAHPIALTTDDLGAASGVAELDSGSHVPLAELSGITHTQLSASAGITAGQIASVNPSALTGSGTVPVAGLPTFVASGASHAAGIVPDPGSSAGTVKFLREDASWQIPADVDVGSLELTDGSTDLTGVTKITVTGAVVGGTAGAATLTFSGAGTVTSVALTVPGILSVSGSPVTTSGTLAVSLATQAANIVFSGPTSGGSATPTFRALVAADIPSLAASKITTGQLAQARGGTGIDTSAATDGQLLIGKTSDGSLTLATLTAGSNVTITNAGASITIDASGGGGGSTHYEPLCDITGSVLVDVYGAPYMSIVPN